MSNVLPHNPNGTALVGLSHYFHERVGRRALVIFASISPGARGPDLLANLFNGTSKNYRIALVEAAAESFKSDWGVSW